MKKIKVQINDSKDMAQFGQMIKEERKKKNLSQAQLTKLSNVEQSLISKYELGKRVPSLTSLQRLFSALDCELIIHLCKDQKS